MADPSPHPDTGDDIGVSPGRPSPPGPPRWVRVFGIITLALVLLIAAMMVVGGGSHGPGRHMPADGAGGGAAAGRIAGRIPHVAEATCGTSSTPNPSPPTPLVELPAPTYPARPGARLVAGSAGDGGR